MLFKNKKNIKFDVVVVEEPKLIDIPTSLDTETSAQASSGISSPDTTNIKSTHAM